MMLNIVFAGSITSFWPMVSQPDRIFRECIAQLNLSMEDELLL
jgi:hypothetical protein